MRAKMQIQKIEQHQTQEILTMNCVCKTGGYGDDGLDEDNQFAKFSPSGSLTITVSNPALLGKFKPGEKYYLDFSKAE